MTFEEWLTALRAACAHHGVRTPLKPFDLYFYNSGRTPEETALYLKEKS